LVLYFQTDLTALGPSREADRCRLFEDYSMATASAIVKTSLNSFGQSRLASVFKIKELRQKIFITLLFLAIYRVGFHVPVPMINQAEMMNAMRGTDEGLLGMISMFSGGSLSQSTIFGLGIMPYISASIIFQLLASVYPPLEKLQKEGEAGRKKDQRIHTLRNRSHMPIPVMDVGVRHRTP